MHNKIEYSLFRPSNDRLHLKHIQVKGISALYQGRLDLRPCCLVYLQTFTGNHSRHITLQ
jgi:hypothetical protein